MSRDPEQSAGSHAKPYNHAELESQICAMLVK
jgi:hypothetical protein